MKPTFIISLDFELFWGMQDGWTLDSYRENVLGGLKAIPRMLNLFIKHNIHVTWATVGFIFAEDYKEVQKYFPENSLLPTYSNPVLSTYRCFDDIATNKDEALYFYASSLIEEIAKTPGMEIGSHTFSHYYCREAGQTIAQFEADIVAAKRIASEKGYELTSIVLPRNQCETEYIDILTKYGFTAYRDEENDWIHEKVRNRTLMRGLRLVDVYLPLTGQGGYIPKNENGIWNLVGSRMYKPYFKSLRFLETQKVKRIKRQMLHAAKNNLVFHLWWHPHNVGVMTDFHLQQLDEIFCYYDMLKEKYGMQSLNMREMTEQLSI